jgi:hypothetical protein
MTEMTALLVRYYHLSPETARELVMELRDTRSLRSLTLPRGERAVPATPPTIFTAALRGIASQASVLQDATVQPPLARVMCTETTK